MRKPSEDNSNAQRKRKKKKNEKTWENVGVGQPNRRKDSRRSAEGRKRIRTIKPRALDKTVSLGGDIHIKT